MITRSNQIKCDYCGKFIKEGEVDFQHDQWLDINGNYCEEWHDKHKGECPKNRKGVDK